MKLTKKATEALVLPAGKLDAIYFDDDLPGFGFRLRQSGDKVSKTWCCQYRHATQTRRITLGSAAVLSSDQARAEAKRILAEATLRKDPASERKRRAAADRLTFAHLAAQYLAAKEPAVRWRTFDETRRYLQSPCYFGALFNVPADSVTRRDIAARVLLISRERGAVSAAHARVAVSGMYSWAMASGLSEVNPTIGTPRPKPAPPRDRVLTDQELVAVWRATDEGTDFNRIVRLLITTGQRRSEVGGMCWSELNTERSTWVITKERAKNGRQHSVPLGSLALDVIRSTPEVVGRDLLFGARADRGFTTWGPAKRGLDKRLGDQVRPFVLHDLRRTYCTRLCDLGIEPHITEQCINHQSGTRRGVSGVGAVYNLSRYVNAVQAAVATWDRHLRALIEGRDENVVPMRAAGDNLQAS